MIHIQNLTKKYGEKLILNEANFTFPQTGLVCLLGPSGCGKSTLLNMLAGFDSDYEGEITVGNLNLHSLKADQLCAYRRDSIGFIFQNYCLLSGYTVLENILLPCELAQSQDGSDLDKATQLLERMGLASKAGEKVENLSGGQKQRVAIARALIHNPQIVLADEPTGALDRKNSTEIMEMLREIANERLVVVITHDPKICEFANQVIHIDNQKIVFEETPQLSPQEGSQPTSGTKPSQPSAFRRGFKNFKVHLNRYIAVSLAISIGILAFLFSLSANNMTEQSILAFQEKNTAFNNGYIQLNGEQQDLLPLLKKDDRIGNIYEQYRLKDVSLAVGGQLVEIPEDYSMAKATEAMSYGVMPRAGKNEISLSPSLAKKFSDQIQEIVGKELILTYMGQDYPLTISGIFNASYDDFFLSSDLEQQFYQNITGEDPFSIRFDVKQFEEIVPVAQSLKAQNIDCKTAAEEVAAMQETFQNIRMLFAVVSVLILAIAVFISATLLVKLQNTRYKELGLLAALGFQKSTIQRMILVENLLLSGSAAILNLVLVGAVSLISGIVSFGFYVTGVQVLLSVVGTGVIVILIGLSASYKLLHTQPAEALRK